MSLARDLRNAAQRWLSLPNYNTVDIVAGTILANRLPGEPVWLVIIGPSASGKTEIVRALNGLRNVKSVDLAGTAVFFSGFRRTKDDTERFSLVERLPPGANTLLFEDFSTLLGKRAETRGEVFAQLRRVYDGEASPHYGNAVEVNWKGKIGLIACSTGAYDSFASEAIRFGDRFISWRATPGDPVSVAERAGRNASRSGELRADLRKAFLALDQIEIPTKAPQISYDARQLVAKLCAFVARVRTPVRRAQGGAREIVEIPELEGSARLSAQLHQLLRGLNLLYGCGPVTDEEIDLLEQVAFSSIPTIRLRVIAEVGAPGIEGSVLSKRSKVPRSVLYRTLEDLQVLEVIERIPHPGEPRRGLWRPTAGCKPFFYHAQRLSGRGPEYENPEASTQH